MKSSRVENSIRNTIYALSTQIFSMLMSFAVRTVFIHTLGKEYLGFNGLFSNIFSILSLTELGMGTAIVYSMYKPVAQGDHRKVAALLNLYRIFYRIVGTIIAVLGLSLLPFLNYLVSGIRDIPELRIIYLLYLSSSVISYFFVYKKSILTVYQQDYISSRIDLIINFIQGIIQIVILILWHNYILYLIILILTVFFSNLLNSLYVDHKYQYLKEYRSEKVGKETKKKIYTDVKAIFVSRVSSAIVTSTDNLLISAFISTIILGLYSNYLMLIGVVNTITSKMIDSLTGSVGNLIAVESIERVYLIFKRVWFINYWLVAFSSISFFILANPFIILWVGKSYLLSSGIIFMIALNLFMRLIRNTFLMFNNAFGHFVELKKKNIIEPIINMIASLLFILVFKMGIVGVLLGTFVSNITTNFWFEPYLIFKKCQVSLKEYFKIVGKYLLTNIVAGGLTYILCDICITGNSWVLFFVRIVICCLVINLTMILFYRKTDEYRYFMMLVKKVLKLSR
ncbi:lipopolysaccharide biosynthesis protein [Ligilactobacillus salivarius]|uniref:lipopolysaccharide biosynthesis protein n=1 Tax=Ligilactobacillus salivarius TaxID=1624 RepID=UPI00191D3D4A|nr:oligosaccharide flippase family protein [Ligilactobacillus salivarius]MBL1070458.1 oligosaccharide flippase family protein [Ligilactobacillus salivarius]